MDRSKKAKNEISSALEIAVDGAIVINENTQEELVDDKSPVKLVTNKFERMEIDGSRPVVYLDFRCVAK